MQRPPSLPPGPPAPAGAGIPPFSARLACGAVTVRQLMVAGRSGVQLTGWPGVGARLRGDGSAPAGFLAPQGVDLGSHRPWAPPPPQIWPMGQFPGATEARRGGFPGLSGSVGPSTERHSLSAPLDVALAPHWLPPRYPV